MNDKVSININSFVYFKATDFGKKILKDTDCQLLTKLPSNSDLSQTLKERLKDYDTYLESLKDSEGYIRLQLWSFMKMFGECLVHGCDKPFSSEIRFSKGDIILCETVF